MSGTAPILRVTLVCHAATPAMRAGRFPTAADGLDARAEADLRRVSFRPGSLHRRWTSPAVAAVKTAAALGLAADPEPLLAEAGAGDWAGRTIGELATTDPAGLAAWFEDPAFAAPGGEPFSAVMARTRRWLDAQQEGPGVVAVTHPAVIRAAVIVALDAPWHVGRLVDATPLCTTRLTGRPGRWRLAHLNVPLRGRAD